MDFKKKYAKLYNVYNAKLLDCHNRNFGELNNNIEYFINYLKFMRDYYILTTNDKSPEKEQQKLAALVQAIVEYEQYAQSILGYLDVTNAVLENKITPEQEAAANKWLKEKSKHWNKFWSIIAQNMEEWMIYDS